MTSLLAALVPGLALANMYDVVMPKYTPSCECLPWAQAAALNQGLNLTQTEIDAMFINGSAGASDALDSCAMPGAQSGTHLGDCGLHCHPEVQKFKYMSSSYAGPWCFCKPPGRSGANAPNTSQYCIPATSVPEQINLQYAAPGVVVVGFVTYEEAPTEAPPQADLTPAKGGASKTLTGVSHLYAPPGRNVTGAVPASPVAFNLPCECAPPPWRPRPRAARSASLLT